MGRDVSINISYLLTSPPWSTLGIPAGQRLKQTLLDIWACFLLCWIYKWYLVSFFLPIYLSNWTTNYHKYQRFWTLLWCPSWLTMGILHTLLLILSGATSGGIMLWAISSRAISYLLYKQNRAMQSMHRTNVSSRFSLESRVKKTIFLLSAHLFALSHSLVSFKFIHLLLIITATFWRTYLQLTLCFWTTRLFVLMSLDFCAFSVRTKNRTLPQSSEKLVSHMFFKQLRVFDSLIHNTVIHSSHKCNTVLALMCLHRWEHYNFVHVHL